MAVQLKKYENTIEVKSIPFNTLKEAKISMKEIKRGLSLDDLKRVKFRIVKL